jgi:hypothetical protein
VPERVVLEASVASEAQTGFRGHTGLGSELGVPHGFSAGPNP